jgi:subtilisin family serine protease
VIQQPDFTATDGGCTTFFGGFSNGCDRFYGTSAAAPHAAAIAALLKQKANALGKPLNRGIAKLVLQTTARSMSGGNLNSVGAGLIDANAAVAKLIGLKYLFLPLIRR